MALPQPQFQPQAPRPRRSRSARRAPVPSERQLAQVVEFSPRVTRSPAWLRHVRAAKNVLAAFAFLATAGSLALYVQVVNNQQEWAAQYSRLKQLSQDERQLKIYGEGIDNSLRDRALNSDMVPVTTDRIINIDTQAHSSLQQPPPPPDFTDRISGWLLGDLRL